MVVNTFKYNIPEPDIEGGIISLFHNLLNINAKDEIKEKRQKIMNTKYESKYEKELELMKIYNLSTFNKI